MKLLQKYRPVEEGETVDMIAEMVTSDTSNSGEKVNFRISRSNSPLNLGCGINLSHQGKASVEKFAENVKNILANYKKKFY